MSETSIHMVLRKRVERRTADGNWCLMPLDITPLMVEKIDEADAEPVHVETTTEVRLTPCVSESMALAESARQVFGKGRRAPGNADGSVGHVQGLNAAIEEWRERAERAERNLADTDRELDAYITVMHKHGLTAAPEDLDARLTGAEKMRAVVEAAKGVSARLKDGGNPRGTELHKAIDALGEGPAPTGWVNVRDRKPRQEATGVSAQVLAYTTEDHITIAQWEGDQWSCDGNGIFAVTHWRPLPDGPGEG